MVEGMPATVVRFRDLEDLEAELDMLQQLEDLELLVKEMLEDLAELDFQIIQVAVAVVLDLWEQMQ
jgi:hypothetical protein